MHFLSLAYTHSLLFVMLSFSSIIYLVFKEWMNVRLSETMDYERSVLSWWKCHSGLVRLKCDMHFCK